MEKLLREISNTSASSGAEHHMAELVKKELKDHCDEIYEDVLGNVICHKKGKKPSIMIASHMDQIGLIIKSIDENGFLKFAKVGGIDDRSLISHRVKVYGKNDVFGVIGAKPPHVMEDEEAKSVVKAKDLFIDIGAKDKKDAEKMISIGDYATFDVPFTTLQNKLVTGKSLDNGAGLAALIKAMQRTKSEYEIYAVATVQEEVGLKGARTSAFDIDPDIGISVDTCLSGDYPSVKSLESDIKLGGGPTILYMESAGRGAICDRNLIDWTIAAAKKHKIKYQLSVTEGGVTDATIIQLTRGGVRTLAIGIPERYLHGPVEVVSIQDIEATANLIARALETPIK